MVKKKSGVEPFNVITVIAITSIVCTFDQPVLNLAMCMPH